MNFIKLFFVTLLCFALVACGNSNEIKVIEGGKKVYDGVDTYVASQEYQGKMQETIETMDQWGLTLEIVGEGDTVVYSYTYQTQVDLSEDTKASILESIKAQDAVYQSIIKQIAEETTEKDPKIKIVYYNADGSIILEHTFTK